jgi:hypothetical protein
LPSACTRRPGAGVRPGNFVRIPGSLAARWSDAVLVRSTALFCWSAAGPRHFLEDLRQSVDVIRLGNKPPAVRQVIRPDLAAAGRDDQLDGGPAIANGVRQPEPVHRSRHLDVGEHHAHVVGAGFENGECFVRSGGRERLESGIPTISTAISRRSSSSSTTRMARFALVIRVTLAATAILKVRLPPAAGAQLRRAPEARQSPARRKY